MPLRDPVHVAELRGEARADERAERDAVHDEAVAQQRVEERDERAPHDQGRRKQNAEDEEEDGHLEVDLDARVEVLLAEHHRDRKRRARDDDERHRGVRKHLAREHRRRRHGRRAEDAAEPAALLADKALDRVEQDEEAEKERQRVEDACGRRTGRDERLGVERALAERRRAPRLKQDDGAEEPDARRTEQRARLGAQHMPGRAHEAGRTHGAVERPTPRGDRGVLGLRKTRSVRVGLGKKRAWVTHAQVVVLGPREAAARRPDGEDTDGDERQPAQQERRLGSERCAVVERHAAVLVDEGPQQPADARRVGELHDLVNPRR